EGAELGFVPPGADAELAAAAAQVVDGDRRLGEHPGGAIARAEDEAPDPDAGRAARERGHRRHALEGRLGRIAQIRDRVEMVPDRAPVEAPLVGDAPQPAQLVDRAVLWTRVDAESHAARLLHLAADGRESRRPAATSLLPTGRPRLDAAAPPGHSEVMNAA